MSYNKVHFSSKRTYPDKSLATALDGMMKNNGWYDLATLIDALFGGQMYMSLDRRKYPDCPAETCKHLSVNWMAAGSRLPKLNYSVLPSGAFF